MNERGLVEVPENAVRDEPLAFGLTPVQLAIVGAAVLLAAALNLLPLPELVRVPLILLLAGPVALAAVLPVRGEPAYRWLLHAVRYARSPRVWRAVIHGSDKWPISGDSENREAEEQQFDPPDLACAPEENVDAARVALAAPDEASRQPPEPSETMQMGETEVTRPRLLRPVEDDATGSSEPPRAERPARTGPVPHLLPGLRIAAFTSFAGGVGKTTLAVESATYIAGRARYRTLDGDEHALRVLLLDASRVTAGAAGIRLGLDAEALSRLAGAARWQHPGEVEDLALATRWNVDVAALPPHPMTMGGELQPEPEREMFRADLVDEFLDGGRDAGYQLLIADLGSHLEDGHRHLIDRADLVLGVVRPTLESLPDVHRLAAVLRGMGAGRKLTLVANLAGDDRQVRRHADEYGVSLVASVPESHNLVVAAERGEPAWRLDPGLEPAIRGVAAAIWPLLSDEAAAARGHGLLGAVRRFALARGGDR